MGYDFTGVQFPIFLLIFAWALQQCIARALPVIVMHWFVNLEIPSGKSPGICCNPPGISEHCTVTLVLSDTHDTSILIVDTYSTIPVSPRSRYTAVYRSSTKYRETTQVSRVSSSGLLIVPYFIIYIHLFRPILHETILYVIVSQFLAISVQFYWSCYWDSPTVKHDCMNTRLLRLLSVCQCNCKSSQHATCYRSFSKFEEQLLITIQNILLGLQVMQVGLSMQWKYIHCLKKVPTFNLPVTLSNLNGF